MTIQNGFFKSINGDRRYLAEFFTSYFASFIGNGVFPNPSTNLQVINNQNFSTIVRPGKGWINGHYLNNDDNIVINHQPPDGVLRRIDRIVFSVNLDSRSMDIYLKQGTPSSAAVAPALVRNSTLYELALADIAFNPGATSISQSNITDQRMNRALCGIVHGVVEQLDTTTLFNQYQQFLVEKGVEFDQQLAVNQQIFDDWFAQLNDILDGDVAANLANMIITHTNNATPQKHIEVVSAIPQNLANKGLLLVVDDVDNPNNAPQIPTSIVLDQKIDGVITKLSEISIQPKDLGAIGNGIADDTLAIQRSFTAANGGTLRLKDDAVYRITNTINMPENINIVGTGRFVCDGDVDFWFRGVNAKKIIVEYFEANVTMTFAQRTKLNRVFRTENSTFVELKNVRIKGATTAIHNFFGTDFILGNVFLNNIIGVDIVDGKEGYGVISSAVNTSIDNLYFENENLLEGRHALYINGNVWQNVEVKNLYVKNCTIFPVSYVHTGDIQAYLHIANATFINCNLTSSAVTNGCINGADENSSKVRVIVDVIRADNIGGPAFSVNGQEIGSRLGYLYAENLPVATFPNTALVYFRYGSQRQVGKVFVNSLNTNWFTAILYRQSSGSIDDLNVGGSFGNYAIRCDNSVLVVGDVVSNIPKNTVLNGGRIIQKGDTIGTYTGSPNGTLNYVNINHGLESIPENFNVTKNVSGLPNINYVTADATRLTVYFDSVLPAGTNNVILKWRAKL